MGVKHSTSNIASLLNSHGLLKQPAKLIDQEAVQADVLRPLDGLIGASGKMIALRNSEENKLANTLLTECKAMIYALISPTKTVSSVAQQAADVEHSRVEVKI